MNQCIIVWLMILTIMTLCMRQHVQTVDPSDNEEDNENQLNEKVPAKHDKKYKLKYEKSERSSKDVDWLENKTLLDSLDTLAEITPNLNLTNAEASTSSILVDLSSQPQTSSAGTSTPEVALSTLSLTPVSSSLISEAHKSSTILINNLNHTVSDSAISHNSSKASNSNKTAKNRTHIPKTTYSAVRVSQKGHKGHKNESHTQNHIFDPHSIYSNHQVHDRTGPHFETGNVTNITVQVGNTFYLHCRISLLQDKTVSWVRRKQGENGLELLTVGKTTYSGDSRYSVDFQYPNNWRLKIESAQKLDEATYECQISTHPPRIIQYNVHVSAPEVRIIDEQGVPLLDKYYEVDSTIQLTCIVRYISMISSVVYWSHGTSILNYDLSRGGISVKTDLMDIGANSTLFVAKVNKTDSGNYTCSIGPHQFYTVLVHVLNEESLAELHHSRGTSLSTSHHNHSIFSLLVSQLYVKHLLTAFLISIFYCKCYPVR